MGETPEGSYGGRPGAQESRSKTLYKFRSVPSLLISLFSGSESPFSLWCGEGGALSNGEFPCKHAFPLQKGTSYCFQSFSYVCSFSTIIHAERPLAKEAHFGVMCSPPSGVLPHLQEYSPLRSFCRGPGGRNE